MQWPKGKGKTDQNTTQKTKDLITRIPQKTGVNSGALYFKEEKK
jgi:hypothetical protein